MTTEVRRTIALSVAAQLSRAGRSPQWLAGASGIELGDLLDKLALRRDFTVTDLGDIAAALGISATELVVKGRTTDEIGPTADRVV